MQALLVRPDWRALEQAMSRQRRRTLWVLLLGTLTILIVVGTVQRTVQRLAFQATLSDGGSWGLAWGLAVWYALRYRPERKRVALAVGSLVALILGAGSTFTFVLPLAPVRAALSAAPQERPAPPDERGEWLHLVRRRVSERLPATEHRAGRILVVDDEANIRNLLRQELSEAGYEVLEAANGVAALDQARQTHPDLIILDVMMPGISGFDVASALRGDPVTANIPILILSIIEDRERGARGPAKSPAGAARPHHRGCGDLSGERL